MMTLKNGPLVSIVVPVYNTEKYLKRCINSILEQTYTNLEIILVDDDSTDASAKILEQYRVIDNRIKTITHKQNRGLFQARITGVESSSGSYITFVDSDDYISVDWIRTLLVCAEECSCDIVAGDFCFDFGEGNFQVPSLEPFRIQQWDLAGEEVLDRFMEQTGTAYTWHLVWNKLYQKSLWDKKLDDLKAYSCEHGHMVMWEDVAFSSAIWSCATHFKNIHGGIYYYVKDNLNSATSMVNDSTKRAVHQIKYINDVYGAMHFFKSQIEKAQLRATRAEKLLKHWETWYRRAKGQLYTELVSRGDIRSEGMLEKRFEHCEMIMPDDFFLHLNTPLSPQFFWFEEIIKQVVSSKTQVVSFDVFDTLIKRLVLRPSDVFELLSNEVNTHFELKNIDFVALRKNAEIRARLHLTSKNPLREEITLDEIYTCLENETVFSHACLEWAKAKEIELEQELCCAKETGMYLFALAKQASKKIILVSDMYLPSAIIEDIVQKAGYLDYEKCYVSSEIGLTKAKGTLYPAVQKMLNINKADAIVHIGDNWESDVVNAKSAGWRSYHIAKTEDLLFNRNGGVYTGNAIYRVCYHNGMCIDLRTIDCFLGMRCMLGLMANKVFDHHYTLTNPKSDYNADPQRIGYMTFGPHLLSLAEWIRKKAIEEKIPTIHFVARDGYIAKQAFEILYDDGKVQTNYIHLSRKALLLASIQKEEDFYSLIQKVLITGFSVKKMAEYFKPILRDDNDYKHVFSSYGISLEKTFEDIPSFNAAIKIYIEQLISMEKLRIYQLSLREYFRQIVKPGDYIFDVGYSGRPEEALSFLLDYPVGSLYIHTNNEWAKKRQQSVGCKCFCFYEYKPAITGTVREHILSEDGPSTVGYQEKNGAFEPVLEEYREDYATTLITKLVQQAALEFVSDFKRTFGSYRDQMDIRKGDASAFFEDYLCFAKPFDAELWRCVTFEDDLGIGKKNLLDIWQLEVQQFCQCKTTIPQGHDSLLADLYMDGYFVKAYRLLNKMFPKGSSKREVVKKVASFVFKK